MSVWSELAKAGAFPQAKMVHPDTSVIGTTTNGNKVFANRGADHAGYSHWNTADHNNAAKMHAARATQLMAASQRAGGSLTLRRQAMQHQHFASTHRQASPTNLAASRTYWASLCKSGVTTSRGMPIHPPHEGVNKKLVEAGGHAGLDIRPHHAIEARPHYSIQDHMDAAEHHQKMGFETTDKHDRYAHHILSQAHATAAIALNKNPKLQQKIAMTPRASPA